MIGRPKQSTNLTHISLAIEQDDLAFLDKGCRKHNISRTKYISLAIKTHGIENKLELEEHIKTLQAENERLKAPKTYKLSV